MQQFGGLHAARAAAPSEHSPRGLREAMLYGWVLAGQGAGSMSSAELWKFSKALQGTNLPVWLCR